MPLSAVDLLALNRLLYDGLDLEPADREAWLSALPPDHAHLAGPLRGMLCNSPPPDFMAGPRVVPLLDDERSSADAGERVGPYRLLREIGRGGMGSVWLAERADGNFERRIALKLPRVTWMDGLARRMRQERRIGARLEHPHIARMYDAGVDEHGRPFIAMEYVEGVPVDAYCAASDLDVRARLSVFLQIVRAVAYAHARLVIHRDLKPANVLVDHGGEAHLLDFGIARLMDAAADGATQTMGASRAYTPAYASPEQILGQPIGVASDVFSLGVMLYELLAGARPFVPRHDTPGAIEEAVLQGDAPAASTRAARPEVARILRGDLDAILGKALKREASDRYVSAEAFAEDIERYLAGRPVQARPDSLWYRLNKVVRRQKVAVAAAAAVLLAVSLGSAATFRALHRSALDADRARAAAEFVSELFRINALPGASSAPGGGERFFDRSARLIEARFANQPDMQAELYGVVARIYTDISAGTLAIDYATRQVDLLARLPDDPPRRAKAEIVLANALFKERLYAEAAEHARRAAAEVDAHDDAWFEATALLAWARIAQGGIPEARALVTLAMQKIDRAGRPESIGIARLLSAQAKLLDSDNRYEESTAKYQLALDEVGRLEGAHSPASVDFRLLLVNHLLSHNHLAEARSQMDSLLADLRTLGPTGPIRAAVESAHFFEYCYQMGGCTTRESLAGLQSSFATVDERGAAVPEILRARLQVSLGEYYIDLGDVHNAKKWLDPGLHTLKSGSHDPETLDRVAWDQAEFDQYIGDDKAAVKDMREVLDTLRERGRENSPRTAVVWYFMAVSEAIADGAEAAERMLDRAPAFHRDAADEALGNLLPHMLTLARTRIRLDEGDIAGARKIMPGTELEAGVSSHVAMIYVIPLRAELLCRSGHASQGLQMFRTYIAYISNVMQLPDIDPEVIRARGAVGLCALEAHDRGLALQMARGARAALNSQPELGSYYAKNLLALEQGLKGKSSV